MRVHKGSLHPLDVFSKSHCTTEIDYALFVFQGRRGKGAIYTFATGNGGLIGDSCAYNGYVNSIFTIAISGVNLDNSRPSYAEDCTGIMASAYSRDTRKGVGKVVSEVVKSLGYGLLFAPLPQKRTLAIRRTPFKVITTMCFSGTKVFPYSTISLI